MDRKPCCDAQDRAGCQNAGDRHEWHQDFFDGLAETSNVKAAAKHAKISTSQVYRLKRDDPEFARNWDEALLQGYEALELETLDRLRHGTKADGPKYDIANALRLLAMHRESVTKHRALKAANNEEAMIRSINAKISTLRKVEQTAVRTIELLPDKRTKPPKAQS